MTLQEILAELQLDPDFARLPPNWQEDVAQNVLTMGLDGAAAEMARRAAVEGQDPAFAGARQALGAWAGKATEQAGIANGTGGEGVPLEQDLLERALPRIYGDIDADAGRSELAAQLAAQARADYEASRNALSPEENARRLQEEYAMADQTAGRLSESAGVASAEQLTALQAAIAQMQQNLTGQSAAQAAALQQQLAALTSNLDQFDETQRAALTTQLAEQTANLQTQIDAQRQSLANELTGLQGAVDAESVARKAALEQEIAGLTAAQEPLSAARLQTAESLATGINLGLESERDRMTAENARRGYLGGSSFEDANALRAVIGARQGAATVMGQAREANAADTRTIQGRSATEGRSLSDELARNTRGVTERGVTGERTLADALAAGNRGIADYGTNSRTAITTTTGANRMNIGNAGATQQYQDQVAGAAQQREISDALARGTSDITTNRATQQQQARDSGTTARQGYFDNAYTRGLGGVLSRSNLAGSLASTLTGLDNYANTGLARALNTANWWSTNTGTPPTPGYVPVQASQSGNDLAGLGAGLVSAGLTYGNSTGWGQPKTTANNSAPANSNQWWLAD